MTGLTACPPADDPCAAFDGREPQVEVGTGGVEFVALVEGGEVPFVRGPQGGYHVYGSVVAADLYVPDTTDYADPTLPRVSFSVTGDTGRLAGYDALPRLLTAGEDGTWSLVGEILVLDIQAPEEVEGLPVAVSVTVADQCGATASDTRQGTLSFAGDAR